jgi:hypothetical protein
MSNLSIRKTGPSSAVIAVSVCKMGNYITSGRTDDVNIHIEDGKTVRELTSDLFALRGRNFDGLVDVEFPNQQKITMDSSIWTDLADALFAFTLCVDTANLLN